MSLPNSLTDAITELDLPDPASVEMISIVWNAHGPSTVHVQRKPGEGPSGLTPQGPRHETYVLG